MAGPSGREELSMARALILKLGALGDVVMAIPAARALYDRGTSIDWVTGKAAAPILRLYPWINVIEVDERALLWGSWSERVRAVVALWRKIPAGRYDLCANLYYDSRYKVLTAPVRARRKLRLSHTDRAFALLPGRHHTDELARILLALPDDVTPRQLSPVRPASLPENPLPRAGGKRRVVLAPAGARNLLRDDALRRWPIENYVLLAKALLARGHDVVLSGGPDDAWASPHFAKLPIHDMMGKLALPETIALFEASDLVCTHDTGPLHLAGITTCALVGIFGPVDPHGRLPQRANTVALWGGEGFACRPCYVGSTYADCTDNLCMQQITPAMVLKEIETLLDARSRGEALLPRVRVPKHTPLVSVEALR
jgi:heptosyltransferase-2